MRRLTRLCSAHARHRPAADVPARLASCSRRIPRRCTCAAEQGGALGAASRTTRRRSSVAEEPCSCRKAEVWEPARPAAWQACSADVCFGAGWGRVCAGAAGGAGAAGRHAGEACRAMRRALQCATRFAPPTPWLALCCLVSRRDAATESLRLEVVAWHSLCSSLAACLPRQHPSTAAVQYRKNLYLTSASSQRPVERLILDVMTRGFVAQARPQLRCRKSACRRSTGSWVSWRPLWRRSRSFRRAPQKHWVGLFPVFLSCCGSAPGAASGTDYYLQAQVGRYSGDAD